MKSYHKKNDIILDTLTNINYRLTKVRESDYVIRLTLRPIKTTIFKRLLILLLKWFRKLTPKWFRFF